MKDRHDLIDALQRMLELLEDPQGTHTYKVACMNAWTRVKHCVRDMNAYDDATFNVQLFGWIGADELSDSGVIGLKQALTPAGMIPLVATSREKMQLPIIVEQMNSQAKVYKRQIQLGRFVYDGPSVVIEPTGTLKSYRDP